MNYCSYSKHENQPQYSLNQIISTFSIHYKDPLIDFTLSNARRFYSSKGDPLVVKGLKTIFFNPFTTKTPFKDFTV